MGRVAKSGRRSIMRVLLSDVAEVRRLFPRSRTFPLAVVLVLALTGSAALIWDSVQPSPPMYLCMAGLNPVEHVGVASALDSEAERVCDWTPPRNVFVVQSDAYRL